MENKTVFLVLGVRAGKRSRFGVQIPEPYEIKQPLKVIRLCFSACFPPPPPHLLLAEEYLDLKVIC